MVKTTCDVQSVFPQVEPCMFDAYLHEGKPRDGVIVCPGGGYHFVSPREAEPLALMFYEAGYNAYVLTYATADRFPELKYPTQLRQAAAAVLAVRGDKKRFASTGKVFVCGCSAGGHCAASVALLYHRPCVTEFFGIAKDAARPDGAILCYPVITSGGFTHSGSMANLLGADASTEGRKEQSLELFVSFESPPAFIWHTADDEAVRVQNALLLASAYAQQSVPFALHVFRKGVHGLSLCDESTWEGDPAFINKDAAQWKKLCIGWLKSL